jgi:hypothetical protein
VFQNVRASMADADFPVIQGTVIAAAVLVALASVVVDVALAWLDPADAGRRGYALTGARRRAVSR